MSLFGRVDQLGMIATLASWRPRVRIPPRPPNKLNQGCLYRWKKIFFNMVLNMNVLDAIRTRKSVRRYLNKAVEEDKLLAVLEAGRLAPSASNRQEWRFIIVKDTETKKKLAEAANSQSFVAEASVVIAACAETDEHVMSGGQACYPIDVAIALDHMTLAAVELGLGTCWIGAFDEGKVKEILGVPAEIRVVVLMPLGYPYDSSVANKRRLPLNDIVKYEHW
jgi:nitroreductase